MTAHNFKGSNIVGGHRPPLKCCIRTLAILMLAAALLPAQQQQPAVIDLNRILESRYEGTRPWWDPARGIPLASSKDWEDSSGQLRLLNKSGEVETKDHPFFTPLGTNGRACVTCHQPTSAMS